MDNIEIMEEKIESAKTFLSKVIQIMNADIDFEISREANKLHILLSGKDANMLIGYRGEFLNSLQYIISVIINKESEDFCKVVIDCGEYRIKREETLKILAKKLAEKAVRTGRPVKIEPMCPQERKIIHSQLQDNNEVTTVSSGNEPNRFLTIIPKNTAQIFDNKNRFDNNSKGNKNFIDKREKRGAGGKDRFANRDRDNNRNNRDGFKSEPRVEKRATSFLGFGSFLGNSNKSPVNNKEYERQKAAFFESDANKIED